MENQLKDKFLKSIQETVIKRKAMFIPLLCVAAFGLVGYVAVDKEAPMIEASQVEVLYGTTFIIVLRTVLSDSHTGFCLCSISVFVGKTSAAYKRQNN